MKKGTKEPGSGTSWIIGAASPVRVSSSSGSEKEQGRFSVSYVKEGQFRKPGQDATMIIPTSIFDEQERLTSKKFLPPSPFQSVLDVKEGGSSVRVSPEEYKKHLTDHPKKTTLTLYEDDLHGNVDSIQRVVKKTVESNIIDEKNNSKKGGKANLGTFLGVFLPCCQNIIGVIFFVRVPWIIGCAGVLEGSIIVLICCGMSLCTALSMSAIATNGRVTAGGTYFMISRSLGPTFGGSVGVLFFLGTSISVAMYYLGTVETLLTYIAPQAAIFGVSPDDPRRYNDYRVYGSCILLCMATIVFLGVRWVSCFAFCAILFLLTALLSIFSGFIFASPETSAQICILGDRLMRYALVHANTTWECHKNESGPIYQAYCKEVNDTDVCDPFFIANEARLIPGIPGFSYVTLMDSLYNHYTQRGNIPGTNVVSNSQRELVSDLTTSFVVLMGIYFPSITGVESGSNYSGDLKDAQISIPRGTIAAAVVTSIIYFSAVVLLGGSVEGLLLRDKYGESISTKGELVMSLVAFPSKWVVLVGTLTATTGAGLQALAGGPRLLQAIADDNIVPHLGFFAKKWRGEPVRCLCVTFCIAEMGIIIAFLDYVAPIVTMFFLMCYGFINFAVTLQSLLDTPHWRPSFKYYHWCLTLFGTCLCVITMFICSWQYAIVATVLAFLMYQYMEYKGAEKEWGDGMTGLNMSGALYALMRMKQDYKHIKNWRPQVLVLLKMTNLENEQNVFNHEDQPLVILADMLKEGRGLSMFGTILRGNLSDLILEKERVQQIYLRCLEHAGVKGFVEVVVSPNIVDGLSCMIQSAGLGALRPNTILMGWPRDWTDNRNLMSYHIFLDTMRNIALARNALIVLKADTFPSKGMRLTGTIDIWWIVNDGGMLLLLGHLLRRHKTWSKCKLRLFSVAGEEDNTVQIKKDLETYLYQLRIDGTVEVMEMSECDMSAYVYERTLKLEERTRMLNFMSKRFRKISSLAFGKKNLHEKEVQSVFEQARGHLQEDISTPIDAYSRKNSILPSHENIRHMTTAVTLNSMMKEKSGNANLVILNLPCVPESSTGQANYMSFLEEITMGLKRMLLVRGTGSEVITVYN